MTNFKWMPPEELYKEMVEEGSCVIGIDFGKATTGLCVGKVSDEKRYAYPMKALENHSSEYYLSALEKYFNESNSNSDGEILRGKWWVPYYIYAPQVVKSNTMRVSEVRDILNKLADKYGVKYYVFGFNADERYWDNEYKYTFVKNQIKKLEQDGKLKLKGFTIVDESCSTIHAVDFLKTQFPELSNVEKMLKMYPKIRYDSRYQKSGEFDLHRFKDDLKQFHKRLVDCYSAADFTRIFLDKGYRGKLLEGGDRAKAKDERMLKFAHGLGCDVRRGRDPTRIFK